MSITDRYLDLIDTAYSVSDQSVQFESLMTICQRYLFSEEDEEGIAGDLPRFGGQDERLDAHAERLTSLLKEKLSVSDTQAASAFHAQLEISRADLKVSGNLAAEQLTDRIFPCALEDMPFDRRTIHLLGSFLNNTTAQTEGPPQVFLATVEEPALRSCLALIDRAGVEESRLRVSISYIDWSPELLGQLGDAFDLSKGETAVLHGYLNRSSQKDIAEARNRSPETVKAQSKAILRKTGCAKMTEVVELSASIAYLQRQSAVPAAGMVQDWQTTKEAMQILPLADGRELAWYEYGNGKHTVLFMHGYFFGPFLTRRFLRAMEKADLRVIAPSRPGFGHSSPSRSRKSFNETVVADTVALVEELGLVRFVVAAHQGGASHAFRVARALEDKCTAMVMISAGIPIDEKKHLPQMEIFSRIGGAASKHAPSVMKMMVRVGKEIYKQKGSEVFLKDFYDQGSEDRKVLDDPDALAMLTQGIYHICQQDHENWVRDGQSAMQDWRSGFEAVSCPQHWIHGEKCPVLAAKFVEEFIHTHTEHQVETHADIGINLLYHLPERVVELLAEASAL